MINRSRNPLVVEVLRGPVVESVHQVIAVIADDRGLVMGFNGNHDYLTYPRSSIKKLQALPLLESGAVEKLDLDDRMLALACASHSGEKQHLLVASQWMEKIQAKEDLLRCGPAWPRHEATKFEMIRKDLKPSRILHNCSGKHLGLISACLALGISPLDYHKWDHPIQVKIRKALSDMMKIDHEKLPWGIDGCGIPTYSVPLQSIAIGMAQMLSSSLGEARKFSCQRIFDAVRKHPQLIGGSDEFVSIVNEKTNGRVIAKAGAEGTYTAVLPEKRLAFALKVHDGGTRAANVAMAGLLRHLGGLSEAEFNTLREFTHPVVKNSRGESVGEIRLQKGSL
ncbi:MAG: asparaginase [Bdellovibrionaceae bacterium]|nr:asparaginase [Pseudobdellovibrionaceae bacterium]